MPSGGPPQLRQMYPIVIYTKAESKDVVKEIRTMAESKRKSTKKLIIEAQKLEKSSAFLFTGKIFHSLTSIPVLLLTNT